MIDSSLQLRQPGSAPSTHQDFPMRLLFIILLASCCLGAAHQQSASKSTVSATDALRNLNSLVGTWRGVGQVKRGSRIGSWSEETTVVWNFEKETPKVRFTAKGGKHFDTLQLKWDEKTQQVVMLQKFENSELTYRGQFPEEWPGKLELLTDADGNGIQHRCTIQQLGDIRATVLLEKRSTPTGSFRRIAAVGYTRAGERLAVVGGNQRKCIVTGGLGTIPVTHENRTYYVCCEGCLQAFNAAPDAIVAEYKASLTEAAK